MPRGAPAVPRPVNDTYRTLIGLALLVAVSVVIGIAYGLGATALDLPRPRPATYLATSNLLSFVIYQLLTWWCCGWSMLVYACAVAYLRLHAG